MMSLGNCTDHDIGVDVDPPQRIANLVLGIGLVVGGTLLILSAVGTGTEALALLGELAAIGGGVLVDRFFRGADGVLRERRIEPLPMGPSDHSAHRLLSPDCEGPASAAGSALYWLPQAAALLTRTPLPGGTRVKIFNCAVQELVAVRLAAAAGESHEIAWAPASGRADTENPALPVPVVDVVLHREQGGYSLTLH